MSQFQREGRKRMFMWVAGGTAVAGGTYWLFSDRIHHTLGMKGADVGKHVLQDEGLQKNAKQTLGKILKEDETIQFSKAHLQKVVTEIMNSKEFNDVVKKWLIEISRDQEINDRLNEMAKNIAKEILANEEVRIALEKLLIDAVRSHEVKKNVADSLQDSVAILLKKPFQIFSRGQKNPTDKST